MEKLEWDQSFSVGVDEFDAQHQKLLEMTNTMAALPLDAPPSSMAKLVAALVDYASEHFRAEEDYMLECDYPGLADHQNEHANFLETVRSICEQAQWDSPFLEDDVLDFLQFWLVDHIMYSDAEYASHHRRAA